MMVVDLYRIGQRYLLAGGEVVEIVIRRRERPASRTRHAAGGIGQRAQRQPAQLSGGVGKAGHHPRRADPGDGHIMRVAQVDIRECDRARRGVRCRRATGIGRFSDRAGLRATGDGRRNVGAGDAGDRDGDVLRRGAAMMVVDLYRIGQRYLLAGGEVVEIVIRRRERPVSRTRHAAGGIAQRGQRQPAQLSGGVGKAGHHPRRADPGDGHVMPVAQVDIRECDRARRSIRCRRANRISSRDRTGLRAAGDDRRIVSTGDRDGEGLDRQFVVQREIVVDLRNVGQRQRLAGGEEIEGAVGDAVGPGRRAVVDEGRGPAPRRAALPRPGSRRFAPPSATT